MRNFYLDNSSEHAYFKLVANFTCPDFHSCSLMDSVEACKKAFSSASEAICEPVSTKFVGLTTEMRKGALKNLYTQFVETGETHPGPDKVMALFHHPTTEKIHHFVQESSNALFDYLAEDYFITAGIVAGTILVGAGMSCLISRMTQNADGLH